MSNNTGFIIKIIGLSALLSLAIKYGGPLLLIDEPFTDSLNGLVSAIVVLPSVVIAIGLLVVALKR